MMIEDTLPVSHLVQLLAAGRAPAHWMGDRSRLLDWLDFPRRESTWLESLAIERDVLGNTSLWGDALTATVSQLESRAETTDEAAPSQSQHQRGTSPRTPRATALDTKANGNINRHLRRRRPPAAPVARQHETLETPLPGKIKRRTPNPSPYPRQTRQETTIETPGPTRQRPTASPHRLAPGTGPTTVAPGLLRRLAGAVNEDTIVDTSAATNHAQPRPHQGLRAKQRMIALTKHGIHRSATPVSKRTATPPERATASQQWLTHVAHRGCLTIHAQTQALRKRSTELVEALVQQVHTDLDGPQTSIQQLVFHNANNEGTSRRQPCSKTTSAQRKPERNGNALNQHRLTKTFHNQQSNAAQHGNQSSLNFPHGANTEPGILRHHEQPTTQPARLSTQPPATQTAAQSLPQQNVLADLMGHASASLADTMASTIVPGTAVPHARGPRADRQDEQPVTPDSQHTTDASATANEVITTHSGPHPTPVSAPAATRQPTSEDLVEQIKRILHDEARRHGINV